MQQLPAFGIMAKGKFDLKLVTEYNETTSVVDWLERVDLICKLSGVDAVERVIPFRLTGEAYDVYQQLSDSDKANVTRVKAALRRAFLLDPCEAYKQFSRHTWRLDESVDKFYAALKKLSSLFGGVPDQILKYAFMAGLPAHTLESLLFNETYINKRLLPNYTHTHIEEFIFR